MWKLPFSAPGTGTGTTYAPAPTGGVRVTQAVEVYDVPDGAGEVIDMLEQGTAGVTLAMPCLGNWVRWPGGEGRVYDGPDYDSPTC